MTREPAVHATSGVPTVFLGSGPFGIPALEALASAREVRLVGVVTAPPRPAGRGGHVRRSPVAERADALGVGPILEPARLRDPAAIEAVRALRPALLVLADYGQIVPPALLELPSHGALNLHPSLLPRHRGASPVPATILAGDRQAGVTLMQMDRGLDTGPIVGQVAVPLDGSETTPVLEAELADEGARLLLALLADWLAGRRGARPQPESGATLTRPLRRADGWLDPGRDAATLERQVRAYQPWPGTWAPTVAGRLIIWSARPLILEGPAGGPGGLARTGASTGVAAGAGSSPGPERGATPGDAVPGGATPGLLVPDGEGLAIVVADGALRLDEVQLAGGRRMTADALRRGHPELVGSRLGGPALP